MIRLATLLVAILLAGFLGAAGDTKEHDFEFRGLELHKVIESLSRMQGKSVMFSRGVDNTQVTLSLSKVTPQFALRLILENFGYIAVPKGEDVLHIMTQAERGVASSAPTILIPLTNVIARDVIENIRSFIGASSNVTISTNEQLNAILVSAPDEMLVKIKRLITELDQESTQIFIEAKIIETSTTFSRDLGIQWGAQQGEAGIDRSRGISLSAPSGSSAFTGVIRAASLEARLATGEKNGDVKVISSPKISTLNGTPANIESITTYSIRTLTQGGAAVAVANGGIQSVKAGVRLQVTPYLISQDQIRLSIVLSKSEPDFARTVDQIPGISDNTANTSLIVRNGQTASIGGLISHSRSSDQEGLPILARLPLIGFLFGNSKDIRDDRELMIFITPTVYRGDTPLWGQGARTEKKEENAFKGMEPLRSPAEAKAAEAALVAPPVAAPVAAPTSPATTAPATPPAAVPQAPALPAN